MVAWATASKSGRTGQDLPGSVAGGSELVRWHDRRHFRACLSQRPPSPSDPALAVEPVAWAGDNSHGKPEAPVPQIRLCTLTGELRSMRRARRPVGPLRQLDREL